MSGDDSSDKLPDLRRLEEKTDERIDDSYEEESENPYKPDFYANQLADLEVYALYQKMLDGKFRVISFSQYICGLSS